MAVRKGRYKQLGDQTMDDHSYRIMKHYKTY